MVVVYMPFSWSELFDPSFHFHAVTSRIIRDPLWSSFADDIVDCCRACLDGFFVGFGGRCSLCTLKEQR